MKAARLMNDDMAAARERHHGRIEYFCSLPWQHAELAVAELKRARTRGACGVMVLANIDGQPLTAPQFAPIWKAIDDAALPVLVGASAPAKQVAEHFGFSPPKVAERVKKAL